MKCGELIEENVLISSGESVLMQTARTEVKSPSETYSEHALVLLDSDYQRTYIAQS